MGSPHYRHRSAPYSSVGAFFSTLLFLEIFIVAVSRVLKFRFLYNIFDLTLLTVEVAGTLPPCTCWMENNAIFRAGIWVLSRL